MPSASDDISRLMLEREADGLRYPCGARILFILYGLVSTLFGPDTPTGTILVIGSLFVFSTAINLTFIRLLNRRRHVALIGWVGALTDMAGVVSYPFILNAILAGKGVHWIYAVKSPFILVCITFILINAMALRPRYPAVIGAVAVASHLALVLGAWSDPVVTWTGEIDKAVAGNAVSLGFIGAQVIFLCLIIAIILFITRAARRTVEEAVRRQAERARLTREQAESVASGRLDALRNLVASLLHEMNTPLGALRSSSSTLGSATRKLGAELQDRSARLERLLRIIDEAARIPGEACGRLEAILERLALFSNLDASEQADVDPAEALERTLSLIPARVVRGVEVERDFPERGPIRVAPASLNLALMTILTNAFEANAGRGSVRLATAGEGDQVTIEIADQGPGLSEAEAANLFEIRLDAGADRVKAGFGLPAAHSLIRRQGGDIRVSANPGGGACFTITLPGRH